MDRVIDEKYAPEAKPVPVVKPGEFVIAAMGLDHGHVYAMCSELIKAGATLKYVFDPDAQKAQAFCNAFPGVEFVPKEVILSDPEVKLVAGAAVTSERCALGLEVMRAGKDYFTDKAPLTTLEQLEAAKQAVKQTGKKYMCFFNERLLSEAGIYAGQLIARGAIGSVLQVIGLGPHKVMASMRPAWFFQKEKYGGVLCDIGSHQIEQFLFFAGAKSARVVRSQIANYSHPEYPELDDFGDAVLVADNGATNYFRVDWVTPDDVPYYGGSRTVIVGTEGTIELRPGDHVVLTNHDGTQHFEVNGKVGFPFFGQLILDCIHRTENAMTQEHMFLAAELGVRAQLQAEKLK